MVRIQLDTCCRDGAPPLHTHKPVKPAVVEEFKLLFSVASEQELIVLIVP